MCKHFLVIVLYLEIYQLGSLFIFGQKLIRVYVRGCIKNVLLSISKNTMVAGECFFLASKDFTLTKSYWFWYKGFINNSLDVTWKFCPKNFENNEIDCTVSQKKNHSEMQKFKKDNVAAIWLCKQLWLRRPETFENELQKREHLLRILFNVVRVVNIRLVFTDWFFYY